MKPIEVNDLESNKKYWKVDNVTYLDFYEKSKHSNNLYLEEVDLLIRMEERSEVNWIYHSNSWHKQYGSKFTATSKVLIFYKNFSLSNRSEKIECELDTWQGNYVEKHLLETFPQLGISQNFKNHLEDLKTKRQIIKIKNKRRSNKTQKFLKCLE